MPATSPMPPDPVVTDDDAVRALEKLTAREVIALAALATKVPWMQETIGRRDPTAPVALSTVLVGGKPWPALLGTWTRPAANGRPERTIRAGVTVLPGAEAWRVFVEPAPLSPGT